MKRVTRRQLAQLWMPPCARKAAAEQRRRDRWIKDFLAKLEKVSPEVRRAVYVLLREFDRLPHTQNRKGSR